MPSQTTLTLLHKEAKKRVFLQGTVDEIYIKTEEFKIGRASPKNEHAKLHI